MGKKKKSNSEPEFIFVLNDSDQILRIKYEKHITKNVYNFLKIEWNKKNLKVTL